VADNVNSFSVTLGNQSSSIAQSALGFFVQDEFRWIPDLSFDVGLRYDWNMTPTECFDHFIVLSPRTASLVRLGHDQDIYHQNNKNFQPHFGFVWNQSVASEPAYVRI
jgi:outer membrane receptor protein involved in Fe transport